MGNANRRLMRHGMLLFLRALVAGLAEQGVTNVRMGLAAHLKGVMNGTFLVALVAIWTRWDPGSSDVFGPTVARVYSLLRRVNSCSRGIAIVPINC
jgi:hypothetical protein